MFLSVVRWLIVILWVGSLWTIGYVAAPTLFVTLHDKVLAGSIAGSLFRIQAWLSVICGVLLGLLIAKSSTAAMPKIRKHLLLIIGVMLACTLIGYFGIQPLMAELRESAGPGGVMESAAKAKFGMLHGISSIIFLAQSLLGIALVVKLVNFK